MLGFGKTDADDDIGNGEDDTGNEEQRLKGDNGDGSRNDGKKEFRKSGDRNNKRPNGAAGIIENFLEEISGFGIFGRDNREGINFAGDGNLNFFREDARELVTIDIVNFYKNLLDTIDNETKDGGDNHTPDTGGDVVCGDGVHNGINEKLGNKQ